MRPAEIGAVFRGAAGGAGLALHGVGQVGPEAREGCAEGGERIAFGLIEHVAQGERDAVQVVLDAQEEERVGTIPVDGSGLQAFERVELPDSVSGIHGDGG